MTLLAILLLCVLPLLVVDLATGFGCWFRASAPRIRGWALLAGLCLSGLAGIQGLREPECVEYEVWLPGLPLERDGMVVVALADLHLGATLGPRWLESRIAQVHALKPDVVLLIGDVFEGHGSRESASIQTLRSLHAPLGVWGVNGNHERQGKVRSALAEAGVRVLENALASPVPGLILAGRSVPATHDARNEKSWTIPGNRPPGALILLSHIPDEVDEAVRSGVGLMLCGHTHGGQIWPNEYLVRRIYPVVMGQARIGSMTLIVNRGTGTWGPRMRLWRRGEISLIHLRTPG